MRIAYLTQSYPPMISGAATFACRLAESISGAGHQVLMIAASDRAEAYREQKGTLTVLRLRSIHNPLRVEQRFLLYPRREVLGALRDFQPDMVHVHEPLLLGCLALEYARRTGIPVTLTNHQLPWFAASYLPDRSEIRGFVENSLWRYASWVLPQFTAIIAPTQTISDVITKRTGIRSRTISYGMDPGLFRPGTDPHQEAAVRARLSIPSGYSHHPACRPSGC